MGNEAKETGSSEVARPLFQGYSSSMTWENHLEIKPGIRSGKPCIKGTRITVQDILEYLAGGMTPDQIVGDFPEIQVEDIRACLAFAAAREGRLAMSPDD